MKAFVAVLTILTVIALIAAIVAMVRLIIKAHKRRARRHRATVRAIDAIAATAEPYLTGVDLPSAFAWSINEAVKMARRQNSPRAYRAATVRIETVSDEWINIDPLTPVVREILNQTRHERTGHNA